MSSITPVSYELDQVKNKKCLICNELIGDNMFEEVKTLARFGTMLFAHVLCPKTQRERKNKIIGVTTV